MARFLRSKFFIIALLLAIVLVTVPSVLALMGQGSVVRNVLNVIATPFRFVITKTEESIEGFAMYFREFDDMHEENKVLHARLKELEEQVAKSEAVREENDKSAVVASVHSKVTKYDIDVVQSRVETETKSFVLPCPHTVEEHEISTPMGRKKIAYLYLGNKDIKLPVDVSSVDTDRIIKRLSE